MFMKIKAKRITAASLVALLIIAAISMFAFMRTTTAKAEEGTPGESSIKMIIDAVGTPAARPTGSAGGEWLQFPVRFEGSADGLTLSGGRDTEDAFPFVNGGTNPALMQEEANYLSKIIIGSVDGNGAYSEKCITEYIGHGIDWIGRFDGGKIVFCLTTANYPTNIRSVTFKTGFTWYTGPANAPVKIAETALTQDVSFWVDGYGSTGHVSGTEKWQSHASSISVTDAPTSVAEGDRVDFSGMTVTATLYDGTTKELSAEEYKISDYDYVNTAAGGTHNITISYQNYSHSFEVAVTEVARTLDSITLNKTAVTARRYETPDLAGLVATLHFTDNSTMDVDVTKDMISCDTWGEPKSALSTIASQQMTVSYTHAGTTKSANITLNVSEPDTSKGLNVEYEYEKAKAVYNNGGYLAIYVYGNGVTLKTNQIGSLEKAEAHVAEYLEITNGGTTKTAKEWIAEDKFEKVVLWSKSRISLYANKEAADKQAWLQGVERVTFLAGYQWVQSDAKNWESGTVDENKIKDYYTVENAVFKEDVTVCLTAKKTTTKGFSAIWIRFADSITATYAGGALTVGDELDTINLTVKANGNGKTWTVDEKYYTHDCNTETAGEKTVTVTYASGATATFTVNVRNAASVLSGIEVTKNPTKTTYEFGDYDYSWDGIEISAVYTVTDGDNVSTEKRVLTDAELATVKFGTFNVFVAGKQNVEVTYNEKTTTFEAEVTYDGTYGMTLDWSLEAPFSAEKNSRNITVRVDLFGKNSASIPAKACMVAGRDAAGGGGALGTQHDFIKTIVQPDFADYIVINGLTATEWMKKGEIEWMGWFGRQLVITLNNKANKLCYSDLDPNYNEETEGVQIIGTVLFKAGLQYYSSTVDNWPAASKENASKIKREKFACLTHDVILYNNSYDNEWCRVLKQDENGNTLESSLTVKTAPSKTVYQIGDTFDCADMVLHAIYEDGFEEDIIVTDSMYYSEVEFEKSGKQTVTIYFSDGTIEYEVTVEGDDGEGDNKPGDGDNKPGDGDNEPGDGDNQGGSEQSEPVKKVRCGSAVSADFALLGGAMLIAFAGVFGLRLRKKGNK